MKPIPELIAQYLTEDRKFLELKDINNETFYIPFTKERIKDWNIAGVTNLTGRAPENKYAVFGLRKRTRNNNWVMFIINWKNYTIIDKNNHLVFYNMYQQPDAIAY